ncbi:hypothetical protein GCM10011502_28540 [Oceanisphaera marina]|uniref:Uncharacterized protein n=1 Tax=Oceanisphaera marina TaxID=2017550 RepID=A0ABQ1IVN7_9GAMM|nr:hypothetical protein GCM10011502_28540 [Oceanisphaera marina]
MVHICEQIHGVKGGFYREPIVFAGDNKRPFFYGAIVALVFNRVILLDTNTPTEPTQ